MKSASSFSSDELLAPLEGDSPCGEDMLFSSQFDAIEQARQYDDPALDQGEWVTDLREADWPFVVKECTTLLRENTKDLRLAVWLTDALGRARGFAGLRDGYVLLTGLCTRYWDGLHPQPEDGDIETRLGSIAWLVPQTVQLLRATPIVRSDSGEFNYLHWETALELDHQIKRHPADADDLSRGKTTVEQFDRARRATSSQFLARAQADILACEWAIADFERVFDEKTESKGVSFSPVKEILTAIRRTVERFAQESNIPLTTPSPQDSIAAASAAPSSVSPARELMTGMPAPHTMTLGDVGKQGPLLNDGRIHNRADAVARLNEVADFFERTEPSSPAAYLARKAASWAGMPLHAWLRKVIKNDQELSQLEDLLDVVAQPGNDDNH